MGLPRTFNERRLWRHSFDAKVRSCQLSLVLWFAFTQCSNVVCQRGLGGSIVVPMTLDRQDAPYLVLDDIVVEETGELTIRPGVKLHFEPTVGITVFGRLIAEGTETERIVMTTSMKTSSRGTGRLNMNRNYEEDNFGRFQSTVEYSTDEDKSIHQLENSNRSEGNTESSLNIIRQQRSTSEGPSVRLTEGPSPLVGRLQIYHRGQWRSVCTNSRNWTEVDMHTVCKELGFTGGEYWTWVDHFNDTKQLLWEKPKCLGVEGHVKECPNWSARQLGAGVCDHHPNLGIRCDPYHILPSNVEKHWRGLRFENARYRDTYSQDNTLRIKESLSSLKYMDLLYAGVGKGYNVTSAIETIGVPPSMSFLRIEYSAFNGLNITNPSTGSSIKNSTISNNAGFGLYVNSSLTSFEIESCTIESNGGDGVRYVLHDAIPDQKIDGIDPFDFCTIPMTNQIYPLRLYFEQIQTSFTEKGCRKRFTVRQGYVLTVHFPFMASQEPGGVEFFVYDGIDSRGNMLATVSVRNETWIQSVTSSRESIYVEVKAKAHNKALVYMDLVAGKSKDYEFRLANSIVSSNNGRGLAIENMRSQIIVQSSTIKENTHIAGIHVIGGAGHVNVSHSTIISNVGDGINVTYGGGSRNISHSKILSNTFRGISIWFNESSIKIPMEQETVVEYSEIGQNFAEGLFVGNFCTNGIVNVSGNVFRESKKTALEVWSCWSPIRSKTFGNLLDLQIGHNRFTGNEDFGIKLSPLVNVDSIIEHNYFSSNSIKGCLVISGQDKKELEILPAKVEVSNNVFEGNSGYFVASLGLNHFSPRQKLIFTQNFVRYNRIQDPAQLNPRSRAPAPIVISSANIDVFRNILQNPDSKYEVASQMEDQSFELNCTYNWMGSTEEKIIYYRIFDRKDRFNLAKVKYIPFLLNPTDPNTEIAMTMPLFVPTFDNPEKMIGGEITGRETLTAGEYRVMRDISVRPGGRLQISFGVTLKFLPSVGIMVGGQFHSEGYGYGDGEMVKLTLFDLGRLNATDAPVRLVGGKTRKDGRLQVRIGGTWGSICNYGFDAQAAAIACRQMGFVLKPSDWLLEGFEVPQASPSEQILMSNVQCTEWDHDLTKCSAEMSEDIENSCALDNLVGIRCYDTSWAGIRMAITADKSVMKFTTVEKAGLLDPHTNEHKPAIQLDFSHHVFSDIQVTDNTGDGLGVIYSDIYFPDAVNTVERSEFSRNLGNGLLLRQLGLHLKDCSIENNKLAGILHDPAILRAHQREMAGWVTVGKRDHIVYLPMRDRDLWLDPDAHRYLITGTESDASEVYNIVAKDQNYVISMQLLNPIHNESTENIWIYDRMDIPAKEGVEYFHDLEIWSVRRDTVSFPTTSSSYGITLWIKTGPRPRGNCILLVRAIRAPVNRFSLSPNLQGPLPKLKIFDSKIRNNGQGIGTIHYNRNENEYGDLYLRKANESIEVIRSDISFNHGEALHAYTPFREIYASNISEITFTINSTTITDNAKVIVQYSRDQRNSNNLFHWIMRDNTIDRNREGGFQVSLPYVWQYNENHTHSVHIQNITFRHNQNFETAITGHFSKVKVVDTIFENNICRNGVFTLSGMEKEILIFNNQFLSNRASYVVQFDTDSQSEIVGQVQAYFVRNVIKFNTFNTHRNGRDNSKSSRTGRHLDTATYQPRSYAIAIKGVQKVNITNNLFGDNQLDYELLAGVTTAKIDNMINVVHNWWGTSDPLRIKERIFDFDDWNSYAIASYRPYYLHDNLDSSISLSYESENDVTLNHLQGRLMHPLTLYQREQPYVIKADLTIMPSAQLSIAPGVHIEFYPSVGILALGTLVAQGTPEEPIIMRPITLQKKETIDATHRSLNLNEDNTVRLCTEDKCNRGSTQGFLEYYNKTTLQWIPMCDNRFTERNVQVVCRQLGFDHMNIFMDFGLRIEFHYNSLRRIRKWPEPFQCVGDEEMLDDCPVRMNGQLYGYDYPCQWNEPFIFINCGERNLNKTMEYWGGIRFAEPDFEEHLFESRMHDAVTHSSYEREESILEHVNIYGAGILHNEKNPAILSVLQSPTIRCVNVTTSANHGISIVSAHKTLRMTKLALVDNLGLGFTGVSLTGEAQRSDSSSFFPLKKIEIPYGMFGLVHICDPNKEIIVEERVVLYYKYDNFPVDCVKIFKSVYGSKNLGFRLMQLNLFNSTGKPWPPDYIKLIDGDIYNSTTEEISTITMDYDPHASNKFYQSTWPSLSVQLHATGATAYHGFVAEVLTLPVSPHGLDRSIQHNISYSIFQNNSQGAFYYGSAGEISPTVTLERNRFEDNCEAFYGNFTSCNSTIRFDVQNMLNIYFKNNVMRRNQGGVHITSDSSGTATSLKGYVYNNVFENNTNREVIHVEGRRSSPYQEIVFYRNIVTRNDANFVDVVVLTQVVSNLTDNYFSANRGGHIMEITGFDKVRLPIYQSCTHNSFFMNVATDIENKATIVAGSTGQQYIDNILVNPANAYELSTVNKSRYEPQSAVDARYNWWGYREDIPVMGRIRDENDNIDLLRVLFLPYRIDNRTLLSGKCPPGYTLVSDTCYIYIGGYMTYAEAKEFCRRENASMPYVESSYFYVTNFLRNQQEDYDYYDRVWVQDVDRFGECTVFVTGTVKAADCSYRLPFICETDPKIIIDPLAWTTDSVTIGALVATILALVLIIFILVFWYTKSKQRQSERLERRNSVRASIRSSRSFASSGSLNESEYRRRLAEFQKSIQRNPNTSLNHNKMNGSFDSIEKSNSQFDSTSYDLYETQTQRTGMSSDVEEPFVSRHPMGRPRPIPSSASIGLPPPPSTAHIRNVRADVQPPTSRPFDLTFQNDNFRETPSTGSTAIPNDYWDSTPRLQSNGNGGIKYKNSNHPANGFMGTTSTLPLQPSNDNISEVSSNFSPISLRPYPVATHPIDLPQISKSDDHLDHDPLTRDIPYSETPTLNYRTRDDDGLNMSRSQPILDFGQLEQPIAPEMISFTPGPPRRDPVDLHPIPSRVKETSLDDLDNTTELDYELDETVRPISTAYLETNMDDDAGHLPPLRGAKSQYIPSTAHAHQNPFRGNDDFKALSSRSKSMPLETEM